MVTMNHVLQSVIDTRDKMVSGIAKFIGKLLDESNNFAKLVKDVDLVMNFSDTAKVKEMDLCIFCIVSYCSKLYNHMKSRLKRIIFHHISYIIYHISYQSYHINHIISYHIISYHIISYHIISYHIISYHIISYHIISYQSYNNDNNEFIYSWCDNINSCL